MALPANVTWEVRSATGNDNNGGGWVPGSSGTDYSQQTNPQYALTGLASAGAGSTLLYTSASADMVGNVAQLVSGTNAVTGFFQIVSVSVGVSITFDRAVTTGAGVSIVLNIGGALATLTGAVAAAVQNNLIWCKGSQTITSTLTLSLSYNASGGGVNFGPFTINGYGTSRGDSGQFTLTTSTNSVNLITYSGGQYKLSNLVLSCTAGTPGYGIVAGTSAWYYDLCLFNCRITGFNENIRSPYSTQIGMVPLTLVNCQIDSAVNYGVHTVAQVIIIDCYIHGNGSHGLYMDTASGQVETGFFISGSVFYGNGGDGVHHQTTSSSNFSSCSGTIVNSAMVNNTASGYHFASGTAATVNLINCIVVSNGTGFSAGSAATIVGVQLNNAVWNNTTLRSNFPTGTGEITLTGDPFTNSSGGDFSLNNTAGAGAACKAAGYQSTLI
jgi:hypothetical protein